MSAGPTSFFVRVSRISRLVLHLVRGMLIAAFCFPRISEAGRRTHIRHWSQQLLRILAIQLQVTPAGVARQPHPPRTVLVANHISWVDVFAIDAVMPARFVAKAEVASWPLAGWLATRVGTLYIRRARRHDTARINRDMGAALQNGELLAVFPEGTTSDGTRLLKFNSSLLEPAVSQQAALLPIALSYWRPDGTRCTELAYDGQWTLWDTIRRMVAVARIECRMTVLPVIEPQHHRRVLATEARRVIGDALGLPVSDSHTETPAGLPVAAP